MPKLNFRKIVTFDGRTRNRIKARSIESGVTETDFIRRAVSRYLDADAGIPERPAAADIKQQIAALRAMHGALCDMLENMTGPFAEPRKQKTQARAKKPKEKNSGTA